MKKNIIIVLIILSSVLTIIWLTSKYPNSVWGALLIGLCVNIVSGPLYIGIVEGIYSFKKIPLLFRASVIYRNKDVRFSISYLFRIKVKGKYLLVKNRTGNYYQPVGGAFKTLPSFDTILKKFKINPDNRFETSHGIAKNDLRFRVKGKYVMDIIQWFNSRENRETSPWREFCEELITPGIIQDKHAFRYIDYEYSNTLITPMKKAKKLDCQEILIYEIYDLVPNTEQQVELERLLAVGDNEDIKFADEAIISTLGFNPVTKATAYEIGAQTKWTLNEKWSEE